MKEFINYIEDACKDIKYSEILYTYKRNLLDEMNDRACDVQQAGLKDDKVISDLIKSEYPDIRGGYDRYFTAERKRRKESIEHKLLIIGGPVLIILAVALYIVQGILLPNAWGHGRWLIIVGTVFAVAILGMLAGIRQILRQKKIFHALARVLTALSVMLIAVFIFLWCGSHIGWSSTWPIVPGGVIALLIGDLIFAHVSHQKFAMINTFVYIPAMFAMIYVILAATTNLVSWEKGWVLIFLGIAVDAIIGLLILLDNAKYRYKQEVEDIWNEN